MASSLFFSACNKFLDINPKTQIPAKNQFETEQGFKDALAGVYIKAKSADSYGKELSFSTLEYLISSWDVTANSLPQQLTLFNYGHGDVISRFNRIFSAQYNTIAHINSILEYLESKRSVLVTPGLYEVIKAECLALRAYIHFDLMRLYGPIPEDPSKGNQLAYVTLLDREIKAAISFVAFKDKVFTDIEAAAQLIKPFEPLLTYTMADVRDPNGVGGKFKPSDDFLGYRNMRMNYYAIKALEARASLWYGDKDKAYLAAKEVVEAKNADGGLKFNLASGADYSAKNYVLTTEHIFGMYVFDMINLYSDNFANGNLKKGTSSTTITRQLYGNTGVDFRESSLWNLVTLSNSVRAYVMRKYWVTTDNVIVINDYKQIPMLRTSELYLILAETAPFEEGLQYLKSFRSSRNIGVLPNPTNYLALVQEVIKEYRKEFYGEGQAFYAYKRLNVPRQQVLFVPANAVINYLLPMPTVETTN